MVYHVEGPEGILSGEELHVWGCFCVDCKGLGGGPSAVCARGGSLWWILDGGELGASLLVVRSFREGGSCCRNISGWCLISGGVDGLAAAPRSPSHTVLVGRHYDRSQSGGGAVAAGMGAGGNGCPGMGSEVVQQPMGVDA